ncbi:hypothetical protein [Dyadobacter sp. BHUBP1]|uniref:hypothetical protein n=1 Tax=Dyadobacter sp. BHUBP1 TaxID=3424178 RepID=UPI003D3465CD
MTKTQQLTAAVENSPLSKTSINFSWANEQRSVITFGLLNDELGKNLTGLIVSKDNQLFARIKDTNYTRGYARKKVRTELDRLDVKGFVSFDENLWDQMPKEDDYIWVAYDESYTSNPPETLPEEDCYYYAINGEVFFNCNGQPLPYTVQVDFCEHDRLDCVNVNDFSKFKIRAIP